MSINNDVRQQIWDIILDEYKVRNINIVFGELEVKERIMAADVVKELKDAYCELYGIKDSNDFQLNSIAEENICLRKRLFNISKDSFEACMKLKKSQLVKRYSDVEDVIEDAVKSAITGKNVCVAADFTRHAILRIAAEKFCRYKQVEMSYNGTTSVAKIGKGGIYFSRWNSNSFMGREFHNAFIYMQGIDIDDYFYNTYEKIVQRCRLK